MGPVCDPYQKYLRRSTRNCPDRQEHPTGGGAHPSLISRTIKQVDSGNCKKVRNEITNAIWRACKKWKASKSGEVGHRQIRKCRENKTQEQSNISIKLYFLFQIGGLYVAIRALLAVRIQVQEQGGGCRPAHSLLSAWWTSAEGCQIGAGSPLRAKNNYRQ